MKATDKDSGLTAERLRELLDYSPETGEIRWRVNRGGTARADSVAGTPNGDGYRKIHIAGRRYFVHRLVWVYVYGRWPVNQIDHINMDKDDNRIVNLREATNAENHGNQRKARTDNRTGLLGASWNKEAKKFHAQIQLDGKTKHLGYHRTAEEAHQAYIKAKRELHPFCTL